MFNEISLAHNTLWKSKTKKRLGKASLINILSATKNDSFIDSNLLRPRFKRCINRLHTIKKFTENLGIQFIIDEIDFSLFCQRKLIEEDEERGFIDDKQIEQNIEIKKKYYDKLIMDLDMSKIIKEQQL